MCVQDRASASRLGGVLPAPSTQEVLDKKRRRPGRSGGLVVCHFLLHYIIFYVIPSDFSPGGHFKRRCRCALVGCGDMVKPGKDGTSGSPPRRIRRRRRGRQQEKRGETDMQREAGEQECRETSSQALHGATAHSDWTSTMANGGFPGKEELLSVPLRVCLYVGMCVCVPVQARPLEAMHACSQEKNLCSCSYSSTLYLGQLECKSK